MLDTKNNFYVTMKVVQKHVLHFYRLNLAYNCAVEWKISKIFVCVEMSYFFLPRSLIIFTRKLRKTKYYQYLLINNQDVYNLKKKKRYYIRKLWQLLDNVVNVLNYLPIPIRYLVTTINTIRVSEVNRFV